MVQPALWSPLNRIRVNRTRCSAKRRFPELRTPMTPSSFFGRPEFDAFLFASVGEDKSGVELTVLSALTRLGFDPWQEAARLSELPRETATRTLAAAFALLPEGSWKLAQMSALAARLVDCLPRPGAVP